MKLCPVCKETEIDDKYSACMACNIKAKQANNTDDSNKILKEIAQHLKHINWNLGKISSFMIGDTDTVKKIEQEQNNNEL